MALTNVIYSFSSPARKLQSLINASNRYYYLLLSNQLIKR